MNTAFQTGPGFYAADTSSHNPKVPQGKMRIFCARIEAYDLGTEEQSDLDTSFEILFAKAEGKPEIAQALLKLGKAIAENATLLKDLAK